MILELETFAKLSPELRKDVQRYCTNSKRAYRAILNAPRGDIWAMGRVHGLVVNLAKRGYNIEEIAIAAGVGRDYALRVIKEAEKREIPIRTTDWDRMGCR